MRSSAEVRSRYDSIAAVEFPIPKGDMARRMAVGLPCPPDCLDGCLS